MPSCAAKDLSGPATEALVWDSIFTFLQDPPVFMAEMEHRNDGQVMNRQEIEHRLADLDRQLTRVDGKDQELIAIKLQHKITRRYSSEAWP